MTNSLAIWLVLILAAAFGFDYWQYDSAGAIFLARKGIDLMQWIEFWR